MVNPLNSGVLIIGVAYKICSNSDSLIYHEEVITEQLR